MNVQLIWAAGIHRSSVVDGTKWRYRQRQAAEEDEARRELHFDVKDYKKQKETA